MKIFKPVNSWNDTARMLYDMWAEDGNVEIILHNGRCTWVNEIGDILLYDHPDLRYLPDEYNLGLFGNMQNENSKSKPWIFWPRNPRFLEKFLNIIPDKGFNERRLSSTFIGKIENPEQYENRATKNWNDYIDFFEMPITQGPPKYDMNTYLNYLYNSKFGLSLPGFGPKCNREIELMALGTVPILVPGVETRYHNPIEENIHYLKVNSPEEIPDLINSITEDKWSYMSKNCKEWYNNNCTRKTSFAVTKEIIEKFS